MTKVTVLGGGNIGSFVAQELVRSSDFEVTLADRRNLGVPGVINRLADMDDPVDRRNTIKEADIIVNTLPGFLGFNALKEVLQLGKHVVDISFMPEDPRQLNKIAKKNGATAVVDFGFAPGMCHMMVGNAMKKLGKVQYCFIEVGGLPLQEKDEYKVVFSAADVLEEYSRPARLRKGGNIITEIPFDDEYGNWFDLPSGRSLTLCGFISDGLRTMIDVDIPNLSEVTLRYSEHFKKMKLLRDDGFFKPDHLANTVKVLAEKWKRGPKDRDMSILRVTADKRGRKGGIEYFMYDEYDKKAGVHSMARVTGYPIICMVKMIASGEFTQRGVILPEILGQDEEVFQKVWTFLESKGIIMKETINETVR